MEEIQAQSPGGFADFGHRQSVGKETRDRHGLVDVAAAVENLSVGAG